MKEQLKIQTHQSNYVTNANYSLNNHQSVALTMMLHSIRMQLTNNHPLQRDLFGAQSIRINLQDYPRKINKSAFIDNVLKLMNRDNLITFTYLDPTDGKMKTTTTSLISAVTDIHKSPYVDIQISPSAIPFLLSKADVGYTAMDYFSKLCLNSDYQRQLFEQINKYANTGFIKKPLKDFKASIGLGDTYPVWKDFKDKKLKPAIKKIESLSDFKISWKLYKSKDSEVKDMIQINIDSPRKEIQGIEKGEAYIFIYNVLAKMYGTMTDRAQKLTRQIDESDHFDSVFRKMKYFKEQDLDQKHFNNIIKKDLREKGFEIE